MRDLFTSLTALVPRDASTVELTVGLHWTAVVTERDGKLQCGLASTVVAPHAHGEAADIELAGHLRERPPWELAELINASSPTERSVGLAAINATLIHETGAWQEASAAEIIARKGRDTRVALVGHFPFISDIRAAVGELIVFEQDPGAGELPAQAASEALPSCGVVALTAMTLINGTFNGLVNAISPDAYVLLLGPSAPMSAVCFEYGIDLVAGTEVVDIPAVVQAVKEGANYRQIHRLGTRLVTLSASGG